MNQDGFNNMNNTQDNNGISVGSSGVNPVQQQATVFESNEFGKEPMIQCPKCGEKMKLTARCCMRCGELNYLNHKNDSVKPSFNLGKKLKKKEEIREAKKAEKRAKKAMHANSIEGNNIGNGKRFFRKLTDLIIIILIILVVINYKFLLKSFNEFRSKYYLKQVDIIIKQIDNEFKEKNCSSINDNGSLIYSFVYSNDFFKTGISLYTFDYFTGYIEIIKTSSGNKYIITITDGKYGFKKVNYEDMEIKDIKKIGDIEVPENTISCS